MAAWSVRGVRLGPVRNADAGAVQGFPAAGIGRHPLDPPGSLRSDGLPAGGDRVALQDAAWLEPVRILAATAAGRELVCLTAARHPGDPHALRDLDQRAGGCPG